MAINDVLYLDLAVEQEKIPGALLAIARAATPYLEQKRKIVTLEDVFRAFPEGPRELAGSTFVQARLYREGLSCGRIGITALLGEGKVSVKLYDNGEDVPEEFLTLVYDTLYESVEGYRILDRGRMKEY